MASGVNVKMGVTGVSQFKKDMKEAQASVKTLDTALQLNEKQFKATGDAESYLQEKTDLLNRKLEQQQQVVESAKSALNQMAAQGVDKASEAYQRMQQQVLKAEADLLDTQNAMQGVADAGDEAANGVSSMGKQLERISSGIGIQNITSGLEKITSGMQKAASKAVDLGKKLINNMLGAGAWADELKTNASKYELSVEDLQRMQKTADLIDTDVETIITAQKRLRKEIGSADKGVMGAFAELMGGGYDPTQKGWEQAFWDAGEALMHFEDAEEREVYAQKLFGKSWNDLIPLFEAGREEYEKTNASWNVLSQDQVDNLGKLDDEYQKLLNNVENLKMSLLSEFAEPMSELMKTLNEEVTKFGEWLKSDEGKETVNTAVQKVKEALEWIAKPENIQSVKQALLGIVGAWGVIKLVGGGLQIYELITGIKGMTATAAATAGATAGASWGAAFGTAVMKASPFLAFLYTLLNPASSAQNNLDLLTDEEGNLTEAGLEAQKKNGESLMIAPDRMHGTYNEQQYQLLQDYWDKYKTGTAGKEDWEALQAEFGKSDAYWQKFLELAAEIYKLDRTLEDLPEELFSDPNQQQANSEMTEAAAGLKGLPAAVADAVSRVGITVTIDGNEMVNVMNQRLGMKLGFDVP